MITEERFKKLERSLKLLKNREKKSENHGTDSGSYDPFLSSINDDPMDTSCAGYSLNSHRLGSVVLASSNNMRNLQQNYHSTAATSSIKKIPVNRIEPNESALMPPPKFTGILAHSSRKNSPADTKSSKHNTRINAASTEHEYCPSNGIVSLNPTRLPMNQQEVSDIEFKRSNIKIHNQSINNLKPDRIFTKWRVLLNSNGQLVIKGTLENENRRAVRSKPVIRRFTSDTVQSILKNIYQLNGIIYDEKNELPEFIRGKFYNGFPDDWENVHQVWRNFIAGGCSPSFRWPTPVTDSDDDIKSEITDVTLDRPIMHKQRVKNKKVVSHKQDNHSSVGENIIKSSKTIKQTSDSWTEPMDRSECWCSKSGSIRESPSVKSSRIQVDNGKQDTDNTIDNFMEKLKQSDISSSTSFNPTKKNKTALTDIIHEDGLARILENLARGNCSVEYIDKIIQMFDALKFFVAYQSEESKPNSQADERVDKNTSFSDKKIAGLSPFKKLPDSTITGNLNESYYINKKSQNLTKYDFNSPDSGDDSDDEGGGVTPTKVLHSREKLLRQRKDFLLGRIPSQPAWKDLTRDNKGRYIPGQILTEAGSVPMKNDRYMPIGLDKAGRVDEKSSKFAGSDVSITEDERVNQDIRCKSLAINNIGEKNFKSRSNLLKDQMRQYSNGYWGKQTATLTGQESQDVNQANKSESKTKYLLNSNNLMRPQVNQEDKYPITDSKLSDKENLNKNSVISKTNRPEVVNSVKQQPEKNTRKPVIVSIEDSSTNFKISALQKLPVNIEDKVISKNTQIHSLNEKDLKIKLQDIKLNMENKDSKNRRNTDDSNKNKKSVNKENYGSQLNPKKLMNWIPKLQKKSSGEYGLIFEGKLLNEVGHIENRKFSTDLVVKRIHAQLIETVDNIFYELVGNLHDTNHQIPKSIQKFCLSGCPRTISRFCEKWKATEQETLDDSNIDISNIQKTSSGRRIFPLLNYWIGEKTSLRDDKVIYTPAQSQESSMASSFDLSKKESSQNSTKAKDTSAKNSSLASKKSNDSVTKKKLSESKEKELTKISTSPKDVKRKSTESSEKIMKKISPSPEKSRTTRQLQVTRSTKRLRTRDTKVNHVESSDDDEPVRVKRTRLRPRERAHQKRDKSNDSPEKLASIRPRLRGSKPSSYKNNNSGIIYTYRHLRNRDDLSDDEVSMM